MAILTTDPLDLRLDNTGDLAFENGDLAFAKGADGVAQLIREALLLVRGEWFLDLDAGMPWFERDGVSTDVALLGQQFNQAKAESTFRTTIAAIPGVGAINAISATFDDATRLMTVTWNVTTTFGDTVADSLTRET